ncbi:hypothetical protein CSC82_23625, partial [Rhodobacteraceae bacterium 4F10]
VKSVEILPGAASALYGANAFNGIMLMRSENPFNEQGISVGLKTGLTSQEAAGDNGYYDATIKMAHAFDDYFAVKASFSYLKGEEWHATDYRNTTGIGGTYIPGMNHNDDPNYDGANVYGDEVSVDLGGAIGKVSRTGYREVDLMSNEAKSVKFNGAIHYRPLGNDRVEIIWNSKYGRGNTIYQGQNRYNLANFFMEQHKLEVRGKNFFIRGYYAGEDAGDSYDTRFAAININSKWSSNENWYKEYAGLYYGAIAVPGLQASNHADARAFADRNRPEPGSAEFTRLFNEVTADPDLLTGSKFRDNTSYYHADGNLNLRDYIDWAEVQVGGSYRQYRLNSYGTIYTDSDGPIKYGEYGLYTQIQKKMMDDRLKFTGSIRYDKSDNFDGNVTPRVSLAYAAGENKNHNFRASFQTGFRNPTTQDQYIGLATGAGFILGTAPDNIGRFSAPAVTTTGTFTLTGQDVINRGYSAASINKKAEALNDPSVPEPTLVKTALVEPEKVKSFEVGYRAAVPLGENKLSIDFSTYYNMYSDFISNKDVVVLVDPNIPVTVGNLTNRDLVRTFSVKTNSTVDVDSYGVGLGLNTKVFNGFDVGLNYTWSKFDFDQAADPDFEAGFNTPEHKVKMQFGHTNLFENFGFNVSARWQNEFYWQSTFLEGTVEERTVLDAQINYSVPSIKSVFKVGGSNLTGEEYLSAPGVGAVGSQYYISWTINN